MRRTPDERILIGGRRNLHTGLDLEESAADLRHQLLGYFPDLWTSRSPMHGVGNSEFLRSHPHMGQFDGVWYALGYAGHGVGLSTLMGHGLAGMLLGEDPPSSFTKVPNPTRLIYRGTPGSSPRLDPVPGPGSDRPVGFARPWPFPSPLTPSRAEATTALVLGILGIVCCGSLGIAAWVIANNELQAIASGRRDPINEGTAKAARVVGIVATASIIVPAFIFTLAGVGSISLPFFST